MKEGMERDGWADREENAAETAMEECDEGRIKVEDMLVWNCSKKERRE